MGEGTHEPAAATPTGARHSMPVGQLFTDMSRTQTGEPLVQVHELHSVVKVAPSAYVVPSASVQTEAWGAAGGAVLHFSLGTHSSELEYSSMNVSGGHVHPARQYIGQAML